ncbi:hypothetical protein ACFH04_08890 [Streptomyces noboritoensis]|uniref:Uncharacterized protein n=1 Tax=Streptomyces noboritoensis TaxID=67337 RepID=A0ABV6TH54_9ACTN
MRASRCPVWGQVTSPQSQRRMVRSVAVPGRPVRVASWALSRVASSAAVSACAVIQSASA